jgi:hypothetical protein
VHFFIGVILHEALEGKTAQRLNPPKVFGMVAVE